MQLSCACIAAAAAFVLGCGGSGGAVDKGGAGGGGATPAVDAGAAPADPLAGFEGLVGYAGERPLGAQQLTYGDPLIASYAAAATVAALYRRRRNGEGAHLDLAQMEVTLAAMAEPVLGYTMVGRLPELAGNRHPVWAPRLECSAPIPNVRVWPPLRAAVRPERLSIDGRGCPAPSIAAAALPSGPGLSEPRCRFFRPALVPVRC